MYKLVNILSYENYSLRDAIFDVPFSLGSDQDDNRSGFHMCMDAPVTADAVITTEFIDDGVSAKKVFSAPVVPNTYGAQFDDIKSFMAKPHLINQTTWHTTDAANTILSSSSNPSIGHYLSSVTEWANKLQGFNLCRGTAVLKLVLNANPFQAGMLLLHFLPAINDRPSGTDLMYNCSLSTKVQQPSIAIDCRDSAVELRIPYVNSYNWFEIKAALHDWGNWYITVLSPLSTDASGQLTADVTLYLSFEDFELAAPLCAQARNVLGKKKSVVSREEYETGVVSGTLRGVSIASNALRSVPMIGEYAGAVAWATDIGAKVAAFLGFSKPLANKDPTLIFQQTNRYAAVSDGADTAIPLGLRSDNQLKVLTDVTCRPDDEMSFSFLKSVETLCVPGTNTTWSLNWSDSQTSNTSLVTNPINLLPTAFYYQGTTTDGAHVTTWRAGNPVYYLSQNFAFWRGGFRLRMKFVKTQFHSGRLQITWTPGIQTMTAPDTSTSILSLREIVDIRFCDEVTLEFPYLLAAPYLPIFATDASGGHSGLVDIRVLNELRHPETVSSSIDILMFWSCCDDFEYAGINGNSAYLPPYMAHANNVLDSVVGDAVVPTNNTSFAEMCMGEIFISLKQILQQYHNIVYPTTVIGPSVVVFPWFTTITTTTAAGQNKTGYGGDPFETYAAMYGFYRGSMRVSHAVNTGNPGNFVRALLTNTNNLSGAKPITTSAEAFAAPGTFSTGGALNNKSFNYNSVATYATYWYVPYFSSTRLSTVILDSTASSTAFTTGGAPSTLLQFFFSGNIAGNTDPITRSVADDFQFSYFIAAPPVFVSIT